MPTKTSSTSINNNNNIRQQIISKTPRVKRKKSNNKQKEIVETIIGIGKLLEYKITIRGAIVHCLNGFYFRAQVYHYDDHEQVVNCLYYDRISPCRI